MMGKEAENEFEAEKQRERERWATFHMHMRVMKKNNKILANGRVQGLNVSICHPRCQYSR